ncbi:MAG: multidrug efflux MFS transporter [Acidimicrobiaceae bacterium]|nr:multidrug efflux MFS transporter [Acidimicrobiaceae bacterium]
MPYKYVVAVVYVTALFLDILDLTIVNVAIPALGVEFATENAEWIVLGYTLSLAVWIPVSGWLGDRFGTKRVFMFAFASFVAGSLLCAVAQSIGQLIAFRVVQGIGGGMLTPVGVSMLFRAFPPAERAKASTYIMIPTLLAPALGPIVGGLLVTHADWRWIFLINVPIGIVGLWFGQRHLREDREATAGRFDLPGFVLSGSALALVVYALSEGPRAGWTSPAVLITGVLGVLAAIAMVWVETHVEQPMLALRLLGNRIFRQCNLVSLLSTMSFLGVLFVMPLYLQLFRGMDALHSGLTTFPQAFGVMISSQFAGRLYARVGPRRLMTFGLLASGLVITMFVGLDHDTNLWLIRGMMFLRGLCMGFAFVPMQAASYATIAPADNGRASAIFSTQRQVGVSIGVAILASILASYMSLSRPPGADELDQALTGYRLAFGVAVGFTLVSALAAWFIRDSDAATTMAARRATPQPATEGGARP